MRILLIGTENSDIKERLQEVCQGEAVMTGPKGLSWQ